MFWADPAAVINARAAGAYIPSPPFYQISPVPQESHSKWVPSHPNPPASDSSLLSIPPESHVSLKNFSPSTSPAAYTREIRIQLASDAPTLLADYMPYFSTRGSISCRLNVRKPFKCLRRIASRSWVRSPDKTNHKRIREPSTKKLAFDIAKLVEDYIERSSFSQPVHF